MTDTPCPQWQRQSVPADFSRPKPDGILEQWIAGRLCPVEPACPTAESLAPSSLRCNEAVMSRVASILFGGFFVGALIVLASSQTAVAAESASATSASGLPDLF